MLRSSLVGIGLAVTALLAVQVTGCGDSGGGGGGGSSGGTAGTGGSGSGVAGTTGNGGTTGGGATGGSAPTAGTGGSGSGATAGTGGSGSGATAGTGGSGSGATAGTGGGATAGTTGTGGGAHGRDDGHGRRDGHLPDVDHGQVDDLHGRNPGLPEGLRDREQGNEDLHLHGGRVRVRERGAFVPLRGRHRARLLPPADAGAGLPGGHAAQRRLHGGGLHALLRLRGQRRRRQDRLLRLRRHPVEVRQRQRVAHLLGKRPIAGVCRSR